MTIPIMIIAAIAAIVLGGFLGWMVSRSIGANKITNANEAAERIVKDAKKEAEILKKEAVLNEKEKWYKQKSVIEKEVLERRAQADDTLKSAKDKDSEVNRRVDLIGKKEHELKSIESDYLTRQRGIEIREKEVEASLQEQNQRLEKIAGLTQEEAKRELHTNLIDQVRMESAQEAKEIREQAQRDAEKEAREIVLGAIYRSAADTTVDAVVTVVNLPSDEMKGRIIGREGRNIRTFETLTGVDVIVDDTPEAILLSGFDPVRREIARLSMSKLVSDGRIHPTRIEEVVEKSTKEMDTIVREAGEQACFELGIHGVHSEVVKLLGKLHYRTSYGQNVLAHSKEVAMMCGLMAKMLGLDPVLGKRCGLMHDIGKAIDRETEGTHTELGAEFVERYNESPIVVNACASHHNDVPQETPYPVLVQAADAISGARPGARREPMENYIKRLQRLEELADSFKGVSKAYAIQAGREIRVIVENSQTDDLAASILAADIAAKIESQLEYPGQIKVTVIRESRTTEYAR
ncbi:ribonuclease Y [bacterium AH-315-J21]|nr:ribonuclease Y [bacterium AH-315-J21]